MRPMAGPAVSRAPGFSLAKAVGASPRVVRLSSVLRGCDVEAVAETASTVVAVPLLDEDADSAKTAGVL